MKKLFVNIIIVNSILSFLLTSPITNAQETCLEFEVKSPLDPIIQEIEVQIENLRVPGGKVRRDMTQEFLNHPNVQGDPGWAARVIESRRIALEEWTRLEDLKKERLTLLLNYYCANQTDIDSQVVFPPSNMSAHKVDRSNMSIEDYRTYCPKQFGSGSVMDSSECICKADYQWNENETSCVLVRRPRLKNNESQVQNESQPSDLSQESNSTSSPSTESSSNNFEIRVCSRVVKSFSEDQKMWDRVNNRIEKRFGFICEKP